MGTISEFYPQASTLREMTFSWLSHYTFGTYVTTTSQVILFLDTWKQTLKELIAGALLTLYLHKKETSLGSPLYVLGRFPCDRFIYHLSNALQSQLLYMHSLILHYLPCQSPLDSSILISSHPQNISMESHLGALVTEKVMNYKSFISFVCSDK